MAPRSIVVSPTFVKGSLLITCSALAAFTAAEAFAKPRVERMVERRVTRLEAMERRMEAAAQLPPRPVDVRRAFRRGEPLPALPANPGRPAATAAAPTARGGAAATARAATPRPGPARPAPATVARPAPQPAPQPALRFPDEPAVVQQPERAAAASAAAERPSPVTPATAIDDGTRSVLVGGEPTPATAPAELLPTPQPK